MAHLKAVSWYTLLTVLALAGRASAQTALHGLVVDSARIPVSEVRVALSITGRSTITDSSGTFSLAADSLNQWLLFSRIGYAPDSLWLAKAGETLRLSCA